jgi:hypothetical protein
VTALAENGGAPAAPAPTPESALDYLSSHCAIAVVTLGDKGAIFKRRGEGEAHGQPACSGVKVGGWVGGRARHQGGMRGKGRRGLSGGVATLAFASLPHLLPYPP